MDSLKRKSLDSPKRKSVNRFVRIFQALRAARLPSCWKKPSLRAITASCTILVSAHTGAAWFGDEPLTTAQDLRYGAALYQYYQDKNLEALSELMVAEAKGGIQGHGDNPEIMAGGFYLAYGMKDVAEEIFNRLLDDNRPEATRNAAWFYLARLRYLVGDYTGAANVLESISTTPNKKLEQDVLVLRFNLAIQTGNIDQATPYLDNKKLKKSDWLPYMLFNLGAAYSREQNWPIAAKYFRELTHMRERSPEHLALYDKAMTAEGYSYLFSKQYQQAIEGFKKVRLDSPLANRALLGYGWAAYELEDYSLALRPWQALAKRTFVDENVQESWVAIPTAYEKLGYQQEALAHYQNAEQAYTSEIARLDLTLANMEGNAIREALSIDRSEDFSWLDYAAENELAPEMVYLIQVFSKDAYLRNVQELRDLLAIQANLLNWQQKLDLYTDMLNERDANRSKEMDYLAQQALDEKLALLKTQRDEFTIIIESFEQDPQFLNLVAVNKRKHRDRALRAFANATVLQHAAANGNELMPKGELSVLANKARIHKGLLLWGAAEMHDERIARAKEQLALVSQAIVKTESAIQRVQTIAEEGFDLAPYRAQISQAQDKLLWQLTSVEIAIVAAQDALRTKVHAALVTERARLYHYLGQARLATARMLDAVSTGVLSTEPAAQPGQAEDSSTSSTASESTTDENSEDPVSSPSETEAVP